MKRSVLVLLAFALLLYAPAQAQEMRNLAQQILKPITIKATESPKMNVLFEHSSHKAFSCVTCHHKKPETSDSRYIPCSNCHTKPGAKERHYLGTFMAFHSKKSMTSCFGCHSKMRAEQPEKYAAKFSGCYPCHAAATAANK